MSKRSYSQHLADKAAAREMLRRRGSVAESETDAESLFSSTTYQSQYSSSSPYPIQRNLSHSYPYPPNSRTVSSSYASSSLSSSAPYTRDQSSSPSRKPQDLGGVVDGQIPSFSSFPPESIQPDNPNDGIEGTRLPSPFPGYLNVPTNDRFSQERKEKRRKLKKRSKGAVKENKSTLSSNKFDSPIRQFVRWLNQIGLHDYTMSIALTLVVIFRTMVGSISRGMIYDLKQIDKRKIIEEVMWTIVAYEWVKKECEKGGRSMRSQVIGVLTILLSPLSFLPGNQILPVSMTLKPITLLSTIEDSTSIFYLALSLTVNQFHWIWAVGIGFYVLSRSFWIGAKDGAHYLEFCIMLGVPTLYSRNLICDPESLGSRIDKVRTIVLEKIPIPTTLKNHFHPYLPFIQNQVNEYCKATTSIPPLSSFVNKAYSHKISTIITILSMIPPISILLYSSISLRPGNKQKPSPTLSFLPLILFIISIPIYIFSTDKEKIILPLMPITLLMALRGSAAKGSDIGGEAENEVWKVGVGLNGISMFSMVSAQASYKEIVVMTLMTVLWITLIGASPLISLVVVLRQICIAIIPTSILLKYISPIEQMAFKGIFAVLWFWGMKKMIENAWAMGGLSGNGNGQKRRKLKEKVT